MSVPRFQKVNFGSYDNYIPVSELSKKSWNQQHFALAFPKPPRPGKKKRSLPSQQSDIRAPITEDGRLGSHRPPLWMHRSLMRISERPSVYLAARRKPPPIPSQSSMGDSKEAIAKIPASPSASKKPQKGKSDSESEPKVKATVLKKSQDSLESEAEKATSKKGAKKEKDAKGIDSTTASEDDRAASKKGAKKDKKDAKGKDSATTSEDDKTASKKGTKKDKKDAKGQDSTTASEDDKAALRKGSRKNDKAGKKSKEGNTDSEGEKGGDKKGKKDLKKDKKNKKEDKKGSSADSESKDDIKKDLKKENKKGSKNKKRAKKGSDVESVESKKGGKKGK